MQTLSSISSSVFSFVPKFHQHGKKETVKVVPTQQRKIQVTQRRNEEHHETARLKQTVEQNCQPKTDLHYLNQPKKQKNQKTTKRRKVYPHSKAQRNLTIPKR